MNAQQTTLSSDSANNSDILPSVASMDNTVTTETVQTVSNNERLEPGARTPTNPFEVVRPPPSETDSEVNTTQYVTASAANSDQLGHTSSYFSEPVNFTFKNDAQKANYLSFTDYMSSQYPNSNISEVHAALRDRILSTWLSSRREDQQGVYPTRSHWKGIRDPLSLEGEMGEDDDSPYRPVTRKDHLLDTLLTKEMRVMVDDVGRMRRDSKNRLKGMVEERLRDLQ
ncbi:hypothetical protein L486_04461 [Kwoniella mangroviensis CBS 10435]|uniref:Uncharacterized protein n=1 Tax=Kwoniella mangroviensis CBS 10435 TaxID=1331196 RepID=A0A1B9ISB2_9TREE|nr:hypothetical protein L486_04461 [Kwoniella mangroviensis CBS 10435]OCF78439.1 hypothetical protein I204_00379 [Kwoniella mangroviensis CBS 8886]